LEPNRRKEKPMLTRILSMTLAAALIMGAPLAVWAQGDTDHAALAAQYEQEAKTLREKVQLHRDMEKAYDGPKYSKVMQGAGMRNHCKRLIASYESAAADAEALAKEHQAAAAAH
jgi:hypothetical protein